MKLFKFSLLTLAMVGLFSCEEEKKEEEEKKDEVAKIDLKSQKIKNLAAPQQSDRTKNPPVITGKFVRFSFSEGKTVTTDKWDIAFRGTTVLVNGGTKGTLDSEPERTGKGGAYIADGTFAQIEKADESKFKQDKAGTLAIPTGAGKGWYNYNPTTHLITPIAGKVLIIKTHNEKYAKVEILNYYKDGDNSKMENGRHYTFNYVYQPNEGEKNLKL